MASYDFDLFIIGAGSGGVRAARMSAAHGARVGICESSRVGGTCVIRGCIPKKLLVYASHFSEDFEDAERFGWRIGGADFSWPKLIAAKDEEIGRLETVYRRLLGDAGVKLYEGHGVLQDAHTLEVDGQSLTAKHILVATGGSPHQPDIPGIEQVITSNEALSLPGKPDSVLIVGGGYIACEFAGIFNGMGSTVVQAYRGEQILRGFDEDVRNTLAEQMSKKGVDLRLGLNVTSIEKRSNKLVATMTDGSHIESEAVLYATGRRPNTRDMGLEGAGVDLDERGAVRVDAYSRSSVENIYAVGDVTDRLALTPVAIHEGAAFADTVFGDNPRPPDHRDVPSAVFSQPAVAVVGLTEESAYRSHGAISVYVSRFRPLKHTLSGRDAMSMVKLIVAADSDRVVGCHMVGADAPEIIQGFAVAIKGGATKAQFDATLGIHPTAAEELVTLREPTRQRVA